MWAKRLLIAVFAGCLLARNGSKGRDPDTETGQNAGIFRGTEGSNPVSSSGESRANLISSIRALKFAKRDGVTLSRRAEPGRAGTPVIRVPADN